MGGGITGICGNPLPSPKTWPPPLLLEEEEEEEDDEEGDDAAEEAEEPEEPSRPAMYEERLKDEEAEWRLRDVGRRPVSWPTT